MNIILDEGYQFGLGAFETIGVENGVPVFLEEHMKRLEDCLAFLNIKKKVHREEAENFLREQDKLLLEHGVLKIMVSQENILFTARHNPYTKSQYEKGFFLDYSKVFRNETSPFTAYKTTNYGDCILEKRKALSAGLDDFIFLNTRGELCECTSSNIFFVKENRLYAPPLNCGMLPGIIREYVYKNFQVENQILRPVEVADFQECFVTNSLMGIMPVRKIGEHSFEGGRITDAVRVQLHEDILKQNVG